MKSKFVLLLSTLLVVFLLSGCSEVEEILGKVNQLLDQQLESEESEVSTDEELDTGSETSEEPISKDLIEEETNGELLTENESDDSDSDLDTVGKELSDGHENEADPILSFEERLQQAGYTKLDPPNGLSIPLPLDWVLVQVIHEGPWEGVFCFDTPLEETIAQTEEQLSSGGFEIISDPINNNSDNVHSTKYAYDYGYESGQGDLIYFIDNYGTTCTKLYWELNF